MTTLKTVTDKASELGNEAKASIAELGCCAGRKLDAARDETGAALHAAASSVRTTGRQSSKAIGDIATGTADRLDDTATYIEDHDVSAALRGLRRFGREHLTGSLVAAAAVGFLVGSAWHRAARLRG